MANSVDPDQMAHYEPSDLDLHCLQRYMFWAAELKKDALIVICCNYMKLIIFYTKGQKKIPIPNMIMEDDSETWVDTTFLTLNFNNFTLLQATISIWKWAIFF